MSAETQLPSELEPYLQGNLVKGFVIDNVRYRLVQEGDFDLVKRTEAFWDRTSEASLKFGEDELQEDFNQPQIIAIDETTGQPIGRTSVIRLKDSAQIEVVPNWDVLYTQEREINGTGGRFEGTGVIVDRDYWGEDIGFKMMIFLARAVAEKVLEDGINFKSLTWSAHNPYYSQWLKNEGQEDSAEVHKEYVRDVLDPESETSDPVLGNHFKVFDLLDREEAEGCVLQTRDGLVKLLNFKGGCTGNPTSHNRGVRFEATKLIKVLVENMQAA